MGNYYQRDARAPKKRTGAYHASIHTCPQRKRFKALKGLAAVVVDVRPGSGDLMFRLDRQIYIDYEVGRDPPEGFADWDAYFTDFYRRLGDRNQTNWLRLLHNPNIAFICDGGIYDHQYRTTKHPRHIAAHYFAKIMEERGYHLFIQSEVKESVEA